MGLGIVELGCLMDFADLCLIQMDRATTMATVNRLQARGFLLRGKSASDGRKQTLSLTDAGRAALISAKAAIAEHEDWLKSRFSGAEVASVIAMLTWIHEYHKPIAGE